MKIRYYCVLFCVLFMYLSACKQNRPVSNNQGSLRDSVLIYKTQGLREFIKVADYW